VTTSPTLPPLVSLGWRDYAAAALLALAVVAGASWRMVPGVVGVIDDDAIYAVTAKALAEGKGYHLVNLPGAPPQNRYPILYPALLALVCPTASTREAQVFAMQCTTAGLGALALGLAYLYAVRSALSRRVAAFAGCLLAASASNFLFYCSQPLSEMLFLVLLVVALWATERRLRASESSALADLLAGALLGLPLLSRTAGAVVPVAAAVVLLRHRKPVGWIVVGATLVALPWFAWVLHSAARTSDGVNAYQTDYFAWWGTNGSLTVPLANVFKVGQSFSHIDLEAMSQWLYAETDAAAWIVFALGSLPWIAVSWRSRSVELLPVTLLFYLALICVWPWPPDRFLVPVLPFLAAMLVDGALSLGARLGVSRSAAVVTAVAVTAAIVSNGALVLRYASESRESGYPYFALPDEPVQWSSFRTAFAWLDEHTGPDDVVASGFDAMTAFYTDRAAIRPFVFRPLSMYYGAPEPPLGTTAEFDALLTKHAVRYMLFTPMPAYPIEDAFFELVSGAVHEPGSLLRPVWQSTTDPRFVIFQVRSGLARH